MLLMHKYPQRSLLLNFRVKGSATTSWQEIANATCHPMVSRPSVRTIIIISIDNVTIYFLKDILGRKKAYLHNDQVKSMHIPQYKNLSLENILTFAFTKPDVENYLPDEPDLPKVPKQWIMNVCSAVIGKDFKDWVAAQIEERNAIMAEKKEIMISMDPVMAAKFEASTHFSRKYERRR